MAWAVLRTSLIALGTLGHKATLQQANRLGAATADNYDRVREASTPIRLSRRKF
jgi:hypothetical protein